MTAFCIGQAKSGTASLAGMLSTHHRAAHEPERAETLDLVRRRAAGPLTRQQATEVLRTRQNRLALDFDIAWANQFLLDEFLDAFPDARVIGLVREPLSWLQSIAGHLASREVPRDVRAFLDWWFLPAAFPGTAHDAKFRDACGYSVAALLSAWRRHASLCSQALTSGRALVIRTHELHASHHVLATFLGISPESVDLTRARENVGSWDQRIDTLVQSSYLHDAVTQYCEPALSNYFPDRERQV